MTDPEEVDESDASAAVSSEDIKALAEELEEMQEKLNNITKAVTAISSAEDVAATSEEVTSRMESVRSAAAEIESTEKTLHKIEASATDGPELISSVEKMTEAAKTIEEQVDIKEISEAVEAADAAVYVDEEGHLRPRLATISKSGGSTHEPSS